MTKPFAMKISFAKRATLAIAGLLVSVSAFAAGDTPVEHSGVDLDDRASLQRGAQLYMNYCVGCHSLKYMRYSRIAEDLGLTEDQVMNNLNFTGAKFGEQVISAMPVHSTTPATGGEKWFGKAPPDLSVISRVRGSDWIYTYLKSFYLDESRPLGWNNKVFPNASMPNPLWELQGNQRPVFVKKIETGKDDKGKPLMGCPHGLVETDDACLKALVVATSGTQKAEEFDQTARDIAAFLEYVGEPAILKRQKLGVWVILFLSLFAFLAWLLKREYWRDVH
ncbi:MAG: cytochrome c1 [Lysobacter sp.]|nr:MAG: cytochrome c1 [Lysobacter sp.]